MNMFLHLDTPDYQYTRLGIAVLRPACRSLGSIAPHQTDSHDMTVFKDDDEKAYLFHSSERNGILYIGELSADYRNITGPFTRIFVQAYREAPAVFKHKGKYYCLTSGCTDWMPTTPNMQWLKPYWGLGR